jgi:hypothetical protein
MLTATEQKMRVPDFNPFHATHERSRWEALAHLVWFILCLKSVEESFPVIFQQLHIL